MQGQSAPSYSQKFSARFLDKPGQDLPVTPDRFATVQAVDGYARNRSSPKKCQQRLQDSILARWECCYFFFFLADDRLKPLCNHNRQTIRNASRTILPDIFELPWKRSVKMIGTSTIFMPCRQSLWVISI